MDKGQPSMCLFANSRHKGIGMSILKSLTDADEEERRNKEAKWRIPASKGVSENLKSSSEGKKSPEIQSLRKMGIN